MMMEMENRVCGVCGIAFSAPKEFMDECRKEGVRKSFCCPNGHARVFKESEADKIRRERDRLQQQLAQSQDEIASRDRVIARERKQAKAAAKRTAAGVCPCCHRTVGQMARHMKSKHPDYTPEKTVQ